MTEVYIIQGTALPFPHTSHRTPFINIIRELYPSDPSCCFPLETSNLLLIKQPLETSMSWASIMRIRILRRDLNLNKSSFLKHELKNTYRVSTPIAEMSVTSPASHMIATMTLFHSYSASRTRSRSRFEPFSVLLVFVPLCEQPFEVRFALSHLHGLALRRISRVR